MADQPIPLDLAGDCLTDDEVRRIERALAAECADPREFTRLVEKVGIAALATRLTAAAEPVDGESVLRDEDAEREKPKRERGLFRKYDVERTDGSSAPGEKHHACEYFVLDLSHDPFAPAALRAYAEACAQEYPALAADLRTIATVAPVPAKVEAAHTIDDWHEDTGPVLWWAFPIVEPPYAGTPLDSTWPGYHTHWTHIHVPDLALPPESGNG